MFWRGNRQEGHVSFYVLILLPFFATVSVLAVDVTGWHSFRDEVQRTVDTIAFDAAHALPNVDRAKEVVRSQARARGIPDEAIQIRADSAQIRVVLDLEYKQVMRNPFFSKVFRVSRETVVRAVPKDTIIVMANGSTLRPAAGEEAWGDQISWPSSDYWTRVSFPVPEDDKRWATQMCFNPAFSTLKYAAINIVDRLSQTKDNRVSLIFTPGNVGSNFAFSRFLNGQSGTPGYSGAIGGFVDSESGSQAHWLGYAESASGGAGDESCVMVSHPQVDLTGRYALDGVIHAAGACSDPIDLFHFSEPTGLLSECFIENNLSLRQAIYWRSAMLEDVSLGFDAKPDVVAAVQAAANHIVVARSDGSSDTRRGSISTISGANVIVLSDQINLNPGWQDQLEQSLQSIAGIKGEVNLVGFAHPWLSLSEQSSLSSATTSLQQFASLKDLRLRTYLAGSSEQLIYDIVPKILAKNRRFVQSR